MECIPKKVVDKKAIRICASPKDKSDKQVSSALGITSNARLASGTIKGSIKTTDNSDKGNKEC